MVEKQIDVKIGEFKKLLKTEKVVLGTERTLKLLKSGTATQVFLSSNCPDAVKNDVEYYAKLSAVPVVYLKYPNDELGILCKRSYHVSVLCITP